MFLYLFLVLDITGTYIHTLALCHCTLDTHTCRHFTIHNEQVPVRSGRDCDHFYGERTRNYYANGNGANYICLCTFWNDLEQ